MTHEIRNLAHQGTKQARQEQIKQLRVIPRESGDLLAVCLVCPRHFCDYRYRQSEVFYQSYLANDTTAIRTWFAAHVNTDMYQWYQREPREEAELWQRRRAQERGEEVPKGKLKHFPYGIDRRTLKPQK